MKKKVMSAVLAAAMVVGMAGNVVTVSAEEKYDLTLYSINTTDPDFEDWLANVEDATGLNINVIAAPTDSDTRQQKITTMLSTGDASVDVIEINDEMSAAFKNSGWLEGLNDTVMTDDIADQFAQGYVKDMITDKDGNIIGVPGYTGYLAFWVNQEIMDEVGIKSIDTKEDFMKYMKAVSKDGRFGYGGSWEKTVFTAISYCASRYIFSSVTMTCGRISVGSVGTSGRIWKENPTATRQTSGCFSRKRS